MNLSIPTPASVIPAHNHVVPTHASVIPAHNHVVPTHASVIPAHNHVVPTHASVIPAKAGIPRRPTRVYRDAPKHAIGTRHTLDCV